MNLSTLPEDELLLVLGFLGSKELLQCRAVCRRLRDSALHPDLWRKRSLHLHGIIDRVELVAATLRLAPCLGALSLDMDHGHLYLQLGTLLATSNCAIFDLSVYCSCSSAVSVAMMLVRQAALGRLRTLSITMRRPSKKKSDLRLVLDQLLRIQGLTSLTVHGDSNRTPTLSLAKAAQGDVVPASLRRLEFYSRDGSLNSFLQRHADTLQAVLLGSSPLPAGVEPLLCTLAHLRELQCPILEDTRALLRCPALRSLCLHVSAEKSTRLHLREVQQYLRQAVKTLETLTLEYDQGGHDVEFLVSADAANLVLCLAGPASSPAPALRSFNLAYSHTCEAWRPQPVLAPLASVMHRLDNLVSLDLAGAHTADFLEALDGRAVPRLERLRAFLFDRHAGVACPHEWAHGAQTRALLRRYPRLHLVVGASHNPDGAGCDACDFSGCDACQCDYCEENSCHEFDLTEHVLFSHPEEESCNQKHGEVPFHVEL